MAQRGRAGACVSFTFILSRGNSRRRPPPSAAAVGRRSRLSPSPRAAVVSVDWRQGSSAGGRRRIPSPRVGTEYSAVATARATHNRTLRHTHGLGAGCVAPTLGGRGGGGPARRRAGVCRKLETEPDDDIARGSVAEEGPAGARPSETPHCRAWLVGQSGPRGVTVRHVRRWFEPSFAADERSRAVWRDCSVVLGMHPDEATEVRGHSHRLRR